MGKIATTIVVSVFVFITYILYSGSITMFEVLSGTIIALVLGIMFSSLVVQKPVKVIKLSRWLYLVIYAIKYFLIYETRAHIDVITRILHPKLPVNPAVVKVPFYVDTDYAITSIANSITNTPGTVVVEVNHVDRVFYVHWIDAKTLEPEGARKHISIDFETYSRKIFD